MGKIDDQRRNPNMKNKDHLSTLSVSLAEDFRFLRTSHGLYDPENMKKMIQLDFAELIRPGRISAMKMRFSNMPLKSGRV